MSLVTSTSASTKLLCFRVMSSSRSVLMVERFLAMILALMAAIFSTDIASDRDLTRPKKSLGHLNSQTRWVIEHHHRHTVSIEATPLYLIWSVCTIPSLWPSKRAARRSLSRRTRSSSLKWPHVESVRNLLCFYVTAYICIWTLQWVNSCLWRKMLCRWW